MNATLSTKLPASVALLAALAILAVPPPAAARDISAKDFQPPLGKIDVAIAPSAPERVYALIETSRHGSLWRSDDGGKHWRVDSYSRLLTERAGYSVRLAVSPTDEDKLYVASNGFLLQAAQARYQTLMQLDLPRFDQRLIHGNILPLVAAASGGNGYDSSEQ
jgi:hypothetical protein